MNVSGRALHLLNLENLVGDPGSSCEAVDAVLERSVVCVTDLAT